MTATYVRMRVGRGMGKYLTNGVRRQYCFDWGFRRLGHSNVGFSKVLADGFDMDRESILKVATEKADIVADAIDCNIFYVRDMSQYRRTRARRN